MSLDAWLAFCLAETALCLIPGPAVLLVVSVALGTGSRSSLCAVVGILAANTLYFLLSAIGLGAALSLSSDLFLAIKLAGAGYLIYLGSCMIFSRGSALPKEGMAIAQRRAFSRGFIVQGANPKALLFFTAFLPQFIDPAMSAGLQLLTLGASSVVIELIVLSLYALTAARCARLAGARIAVYVERIGGAFLVAAGLRLAAVRNS